MEDATRTTPLRSKQARRWIILLCIPISLAAYFALRPPQWRAVDFIRLSRYWTGLFSRLAALPDRAEAALLRGGVIAFQPVTISLRNGVRMTVDPTDLIGHELILRGEWEKEESHWIDASLRPGDTFVDVGAHHGTYSLRAAQLVGLTGQVIAIEPNPPSLQRLRQNIQLNAFSNIAVAPVACGVREGKLTLYESSPSNTGMASLSASNAGGSGAVIASHQVDIVPLDQVIEKLAPQRRIGLIKVDTEGAETIVLAGASRTIARHRPAIIVEVVAELLVNMNSSVSELEGLLHQAGYRKAQSSRTNALWKPRP